MLHKVKREIKVDNVFQFVYEFGLEEEFKKDYNLENVEDWNFSITDQEIIEKYLDDMPEFYFVTYNPENTGSFTIWEFEHPKIYEIIDPDNADEILFKGNEYFLKKLLEVWLEEKLNEEIEEEEKSSMKERWDDFSNPEKRRDFIEYLGLQLIENEI